MFGSKFHKHALRQNVRNLKNNLSQTPHKTSGAQGVKNINAAVASAVDQGGGGAAKATDVKGVGGYNQVRNRVMETPNAAMDNASHATGGLKKSRVSIGL